jgi:hypothetical protein
MTILARFSRHATRFTKNLPYPRLTYCTFKRDEETKNAQDTDSAREIREQAEAMGVGLSCADSHLRGVPDRHESRDSRSHRAVGHSDPRDGENHPSHLQQPPAASIQESAQSLQRTSVPIPRRDQKPDQIQEKPQDVSFRETAEKEKMNRPSSKGFFQILSFSQLLRKIFLLRTVLQRGVPIIFSIVQIPHELGRSVAQMNRYG